MSLPRRTLWILATALFVIILLVLLLAPGSRNLQQGSTYGRSPDGYGAWYAYMEQRGFPVQRWRKPLGELTNRPDSLTLLRVANGVQPLEAPSRSWVRRGNVVVLLGSRAPTTSAPFRQDVASPAGMVRIETSRRQSQVNALLRDKFGAIVWEEPVGAGKIIHASTPYLAANAYQDMPGNFEYLAKLVSEPGKPIWVDEYLHGYKDTEQVRAETSSGLLGYLAKTPLALLAVQSIVFLAVLLWGQNQRLGKAIALSKPSIDNSTAYIEAMSAVLHKAGCHEFVWDTLCKAEHLEIQKALGLGSEPLPLQSALDQWVQQTGQPATELKVVLQPPRQRLRETDLREWLDKLQSIRKNL